ncbi:UDP-glucuronosyltransferase 2C1-like isoform X2 [Amblyraja radiata]|uniref:UDP-glucuronosyltransferase 2C1-like isoform X2 n=1 Tax=Amblyraja radiata TaxID=386614 RepID=UPI001402F182|nr:UDP-glucuronosyltransferase 2C1-like isoform X2 [Amblyraja radiata]
MGFSQWNTSVLVTCALGIIITLSCSVTYGANILVVPFDGSHWVNMRVLVKELRRHEHNITVLHSSTSWYIKKEPEFYQSLIIESHGSTGLVEDANGIQTLVQNTLAISNANIPLWTFLQLQFQLTMFMHEGHLWLRRVTISIFENKALLEQIADANFDLILADPIVCAGPMLAYYFNIPLVYNVRWMTAEDAHFFAAPSPPSYVPVFRSQLTDKMSFLQRVHNVLQHFLQFGISEFVINPLYDDLCQQYLGRDIDIKMVLLRADVWLMRIDFVFEFPRPMMPNFVYIGGFQCQPPKPLDEELQTFVDSSGEHGIVVMSLGTLIDTLSLDLTMKIAEALAQIPQKVIWRHNGDIPPNIGNNTLIAKWIPQNDLLGHAKTRAFISHGGTNGLYEAIYHGVPVVGLPLFYDQFDNMVKLETRGAAKVVNVAFLQSSDLVSALNEIINNSTYRENMQKLSLLHRDQPETPMDRAIFWIEYTARHKGAAQLRSESYKFPWYVYYSVDVIMFLGSITLIIVLLIVFMMKKLFVVLKRKEKVQ